MTWRECTLGEVVRFQRGHDLPEQARKPGSVPVIGSAGQNGWHNETRANGPGVSIGRSGASIGKVTYTPVDCWPHNACLYVTDFLGNDPRFVYYFLKTKDLTLLNSGAAQPSLNRNFVHMVPVRIPGPDEQAAIVAILSAYDDLIENNRWRIALLEEAARLLYREWFIHFRFPGRAHVKIIAGIPEGWERVRLAEKFDTTSGGTPSRNNPDFFSGNINWVKTQELNERPIFETSEKITEDAIAQSSVKLLPKQTLLVSIYGNTNIGRTGLLAAPGSSNQACVALLPKRRKEDWIYAQLWLQQHREQIVGLAQGAAQTNISQKSLLQNSQWSMTFCWLT